MQATFRRPRCDFRTRRVTPQRVTTPLKPLPRLSERHSGAQAALGGSDDIDHLILSEDVLDLHLLLQQVHHEIHLLNVLKLLKASTLSPLLLIFEGLVRRAAAIHLDLLDVSLLLTDLHFAHLTQRPVSAPCGAPGCGRWRESLGNTSWRAPPLKRMALRL